MHQRIPCPMALLNLMSCCLPDVLVCGDDGSQTGGTAC